jgi:hypothetical protein
MTALDQFSDAAAHATLTLARLLVRERLADGAHFPSSRDATRHMTWMVPSVLARVGAALASGAPLRAVSAAAGIKRG